VPSECLKSALSRRVPTKVPDRTNTGRSPPRAGTRSSCPSSPGQAAIGAPCSQRELAKVAKLANELELPAGHTLIHEDAEVAYSFFVLVDGEAEVRRRNRRVATLGPGDCFGELALILRRPRTATVTLTAPSRLLSISAHNFRPLLMTSPEIQFKLLEALAERLAPATT
jgi:CRP-like cAMP-binding protein